jgi:hypothetical protein
MAIIKAGTKEWEDVMQVAVSYQPRLDYQGISEELLKAETGDLMVVQRPHQHKSNVIHGLERQGLSHNIHFKILLAKNNNKEEILVIEVLAL